MPQYAEIVPWIGDPTVLVSEAPVNRFQGGYDKALKDAAGPSNPVLQRLDQAFSSLPGAELSVELEVLHFDSGQDVPTNTSRFLYTGFMGGDGTFDLEQTSVAKKGGSAFVRTHRRAYDGSLLAYESDGVPVGAIYTSTYAEKVPIWRVEILPHLRPLHWWIDNPLHVSRFPEHTFTQKQSEDITVLSKEATLGGRSYVDSKLFIDADSFDFPRLIRSQTLNEHGNVIEQVDFDAYAQIGDGVVRPLSFTHTVFADGLPQGQRIQWNYRILSAEVLDDIQVDDSCRGIYEGSSTTWDVWL